MEWHAQSMCTLRKISENPSKKLLVTKTINNKSKLLTNEENFSPWMIYWLRKVTISSSLRKIYFPNDL